MLYFTTVSKKDFFMHIGSNIARIRAIRQIKQSSLAQKLGLSQQAYSKIEQREIIDDELLDKIAEVLEMPKDIFYQDNPTIQSNYQQGGIVYNMAINPIEKIIELYDKILKCEQIIQELRAENINLRHRIKNKT